MMTKCPICDSTEIIPDLWVYTRIDSDRDTPYVSLKPPKGKSIESTIRGAICGECGHIDLFVKNDAELLDAYKNGHVSPK